MAYVYKITNDINGKIYIARIAKLQTAHFLFTMIVKTEIIVIGGVRYVQSEV